MIAFLSNVSKTFAGRNKLCMPWHVRSSRKFILVAELLSNSVGLVWELLLPRFGYCCSSASCHTAMNFLKSKKKHFNNIDSV